MQSIDEPRLDTDLQYRFDFLAEFIGFGSADSALIQAFAPHLGPKIGELVDATYSKLLEYDATARHFVPKQHGYEGSIPADLAELTSEHPQIQFRKDHLNRYFMQLIGRTYDAKMVIYLDMVGKIHTPKSGSQQINVPLIQMNVLMGFLSDILIAFVADSDLSAENSIRTIRAFNKLLWIQNDLINRHYAHHANVIPV